MTARLIRPRMQRLPPPAEARTRGDYLLLALVAVLLIVGLQALYSASFVSGLNDFNSPWYYLTRQLLGVGLGMVVLFVCARIDYHRWLTWSPFIMAAVILLLLLLMVPGVGTTAGGSTRWFSLGPIPFQIQPSELAKLGMIIYIAAWLATRGERLQRFGAGAVPFMIVVGLVAALVLLQPDLGTTTILVLSSVALFFLAGANLRHVGFLLLSIVLAVVPVIASASYRNVRWKSFVDPWADAQGSGYHIIQSLIAIGSGGLFGLGLGSSRQKFSYVFGAHTDAIFAIIAEELGLVGSVLVIGLFAALAYRGLRIVLAAPDSFGALLAGGVTVWLALQALINIGGITKTIPFTGVPLPFISYGPSSLLVSMAGIGILLNISRQARSAPRGQARPVRVPPAGDP